MGKKRKMRVTTVALTQSIVIWLTMMLISGCVFYIAIQETKLILSQTEETRCISTSQNESLFKDGFYKTDQYYCVWTQHRTSTEVATVRDHEVCHYLVEADKDHFC